MKRLSTSVGSLKTSKAQSTSDPLKAPNSKQRILAMYLRL